MNKILVQNKKTKMKIANLRNIFT